MTLLDDLREARAALAAAPVPSPEWAAERDRQLERIDRQLEQMDDPPQLTATATSTPRAIHGPVTGPAPDELQGQGDRRKNETSSTDVHRIPVTPPKETHP